jgi:hypothetical protein
MQLETCAMSGRLLLFKNAPSFVFQMAGGDFKEKSLEVQQQEYQNDLLKRYIDSYMDAVEIIIKEIFKGPVEEELHKSLLSIGHGAIIEALQSASGIPGTLDEHVYKTIRLRISEELRRAA